jgi:hypothetical protein
MIVVRLKVIYVKHSALFVSLSAIEYHRRDLITIFNVKMSGIMPSVIYV